VPIVSHLSHSIFCPYYNAELLAPTDNDFQLMNAIGFGQCSNITSQPGLFAAVKASSPLFDFGGSFNLSGWLANVTFSGGSVLKYDVTKFRRLSLTTLLSNGLCAAVPISDLSLLSPTETFESMGLNLSSILESALFNSTHVMLTTANSEIISTVAQSILSWVLTSVEELASGVARAALSRGVCTHDKYIAPNEVPGDSIKVTTVLFVASAVFLLATAVFIFQRWCASRRPR
jgi:hypothetical protein